MEEQKKTEDKSIFSLPSLLDALKMNTSPNVTIVPSANTKLEFLFEDEYVPNGPSWGSRICYGTGISYLVGLGLGGTWGLYDGLRNPQGRTSLLLRRNCILNACTSRGPFVANSFGIVALLYNLVHGAIIKARNGKYDEASATSAAAIAGAVFKSTAGIKPAITSGATIGSLMLAYQLWQNYRIGHENDSYFPTVFRTAS